MSKITDVGVSFPRVIPVSFIKRCGPKTLALGALDQFETEIDKPSSAVELAVGGLDLVWLGAVCRWLNDQSIKPLYLLGGTRVGNPSDDDGVAGVPCLEKGEWYIGLAALALEESSLGSEGQAAERNWAGCAAVDQAVDRVRLIGIVGREDVVGKAGRVV